MEIGLWERLLGFGFIAFLIGFIALYLKVVGKPRQK